MWSEFLNNPIVREVQENKPLTLEELRGMKGEPVWCTYNHREPRWMLIHDNGVYNADVSWHFADYGNIWLAYRCKPEG